MNKYIVKIIASILFGIIYGFIVKLGGYDLGILVALINILIELLVKEGSNNEYKR